MSDTIETGDTVYHEPTDETFVVGRTVDFYIYPWSAQAAQERRLHMADCVLVSKPTNKELEDLVDELKKLPITDHRHYDGKRDDGRNLPPPATSVKSIRKEAKKGVLQARIETCEVIEGMLVDPPAEIIEAIQALAEGYRAELAAE